MEDPYSEFVNIAKEGLDHYCNIEKDVEGNTIVGELHINPKGLTEEEKKEWAKLLEENSDSIFIVESDMSKSKIYSNIGVEDTFMNKTIKFTQENNKRLEIMHDELVYNQKGERYELWRRMGTTISEGQYSYMFLVSNYIINGMLINPANPPSLEDIRHNIISNKEYTEAQKYEYEKALTTISLASGYGDLDKLLNATKAFVAYDSVKRENYYQEKVSKIKLENPGKKIFAVFGGDHQEGIMKTMENPDYRTDAEDQKMLKVIEDLRNTFSIPSVMNEANKKQEIVK